jgi:hypothetical protein
MAYIYVGNRSTPDDKKKQGRNPLYGAVTVGLDIMGLRSRTDNTKLTWRSQAERLQELDRQWQYYQQQFEQQFLKDNDLLKQWISRIADYDRQIDDLKRKIQNIETELNQPSCPVDNGLVKPARGFIMYGPPGTESLFLNSSVVRE